MKEAVFYKKLKNNSVQCQACNRYCTIEENQSGFCRVRKNLSGKLFSTVYNRTLTLTIDPIEKKPLFHFKPGSTCNGVSTYGCNFACKFCQNSNLSQEFVESQIEEIEETTPKQIVENTVQRAADGIAYTYNEPTIFCEYALDTMKLAKKEGLYNVWVSNGYFSKQLAKAIAPSLDAINIDLKGSKEFYAKLCGGVNIEKVKENIQFMSKKTHLEVTNLIVPGWNDKKEQIKKEADFIASIDKEIPLHFSRFFPYYKMLDTPITPLETLHSAKKLAEKAGLKYVYIGNVPEESNTFCPKCNSLLIERSGFSALSLGLDKNKCSKCNASIPIVL